jgi:predicted N-acyltransferase
MIPMQLLQADSLDSVSAAEWNALAGGQNPFLRHEFLAALERHDCLHRYGWQPCHLLARDKGKLAAALPLYIKTNSYGEFVFDWQWASAYERAGGRYYPKLVSALPYTPATGSRLLAAPGAHEACHLLTAGAEELARRLRLSSLHYLFTNPVDTDFLRQRGLMLRMGCQFHWENQGYRDFQDYLDAFSSKKRKQIRRERRDAQVAGMELEIVDGHQATEEHWRIFHQFYVSTFDRKSGAATLSEAFFRAIGATMPDQVALVLARYRGEYVAAAFNLAGSDTLYGRHYGCVPDCAERFPHLHFEVCYYQTLDYCIRRQLRRFEAGAQGEHKLSRGFLPVPTWSAHWFADPGFAQAVDRFLRQETPTIEEYIAELQQHSPFKDSAE